jgi:hypothetical protein
MALFADGPASTIDDLGRIDSGLLDTASTLGIDVTAKLELAHAAIAADIQIWLDRMPGNRLEQVVATDTIRTWEAMQALALVYREAYFADLAERYRARWDEYARIARDSYERFVAGGMGIALNPVRRASAPLLSSTPGPQAGGSFYACVAWVNAAGQEGAASEASSVDIVDGHLMVVTSTGTPSNATGFNIYAGPTLARLALQNDVPLPPGISFTYVPGATNHTKLPGTGQTADINRPLRRTLLRG